MDNNFDDSTENQLLHSSRNGEIDVVKHLLDKRRDGEIQVDINCKGKELIPMVLLSLRVTTSVSPNAKNPNVKKQFSIAV